MVRTPFGKYNHPESESCRVVLLWYNTRMENEQNTDNVIYIDEFPELKKRVWLRRLAEARLGQDAVASTVQAEWSKVLIFEPPQPPNATA